MKQFQKLLFKPGINREGTNYSAEGFWWDCDRVRFRNGLPETIGGWVKFIQSKFLGVCRALRSWILLDGTALVAIGTSKKLYIERFDGLYNVTPIRISFTLANPITTTVNSDIITIDTGSPHGAFAGDYIEISSATGFNGIPTASLNANIQILTVPTVSTITVKLDTIATASGSGGGAAVKVDFEISIGGESAAVGSGWGVGPWSRGAWNSEWLVPFSSADLIRIWSLPIFGEDLVAAILGGAIYYWDATNGTAAHAVLLSSLGGATGVPPQVGLVLVTAERHVVAFGATDLVSAAYDPMLIRWCSQEVPTDWTPTVINSAGDFKLALGDHIEAATITRDEILVMTDVAVYSMRYSGPPYVFDIRQIADNITCAGPNAVITLNNVTYWMGQHKFYMYNGTTQDIPCTVHRHVFQDFNHAQARQICCGHVEEYSEVWWFYPSKTSNVLNRYVVYNYAQQIWYIGKLGRTAWVRHVETQDLIAASDDGYLYVHEFGTEDGSTTPSSPINAYIESSDFDLQDGTSFYFVERIIPDVRFDRSTAQVPEVHFTIKSRDFPGQAYKPDALTTVKQSTTIPVDQYTQEAWVRVRARHLALRVECDNDDKGTAWQIGAPRLSVRTDGRR